MPRVFLMIKMVFLRNTILQTNIIGCMYPFGRNRDWKALELLAMGGCKYRGVLISNSICSCLACPQQPFSLDCESLESWPQTFSPIGSFYQAIQEHVPLHLPCVLVPRYKWFWCNQECVLWAHAQFWKWQTFCHYLRGYFKLAWGNVLFHCPSPNSSLLCPLMAASPLSPFGYWGRCSETNYMLDLWHPTWLHGSWVPCGLWDELKSWTGSVQVCEAAT